jgi:hypothetical protein
MRWLPVSTVAVALLGLLAQEAHAEDVRDLPTRIGVLPSIGVGLGSIGNAPQFPSLIGLTTLGIEVHGEVPPYGGFVRFQFDSSGLDGRWTAPSFTVGGSYRFFGNGVDRLALVGRAGILYERWHALSVSGNCPIDLFFPSNCKAAAAPAPSGNILVTQPIVSVTSDDFGLMAGARVELPIRAFYLAVDSEVGGLVDVSESSPGTVLHFRLSLVAAFRDARSTDNEPANRDRYRRRGY